MKNIFLEKNHVLMENRELPLNHEEICENESTQPLNDDIYDIIHENDEFSQEFIDRMKKMEKEKFIDVDNLDDLFD